MTNEEYARAATNYVMASALQKVIGAQPTAPQPAPAPTLTPEQRMLDSAIETVCKRWGVPVPPPRDAALSWTVAQPPQQISSQPPLPSVAATPAPSAPDIAGLSVEKIAINVESSRSSLESARTGLRNAPPERLVAGIENLERAMQTADVLLAAIIKRAEAGVNVGKGPALEDAHELAQLMARLENASRAADSDLMAARHRS